MPRKPSVRSEVNPAGPVTQPCMPSDRSASMRSRISSTVSRTSPDESIGTKICAASSSSDTIGGETPSTTPGRSAISSERSLISAWSSSERAPSPVTTTTAGMVSSPRKSGSRSETCVASALSGRKLDWSLVATSSTFPKYGPPMEPPMSQTRTRTIGMPTRAHRGGVRRTCCGEDI